MAEHGMSLATSRSTSSYEEDRLHGGSFADLHSKVLQAVEALRLYHEHEVASLRQPLQTRAHYESKTEDLAKRFKPSQSRRRQFCVAPTEQPQCPNPGEDFVPTLRSCQSNTSVGCSEVSAATSVCSEVSTTSVATSVEGCEGGESIPVVQATSRHAAQSRRLRAMASGMTTGFFSDEAGQWWLRLRLARVMKSTMMEAAMSVLILLSCITLGLVAQCSVMGASRDTRLALYATECVLTGIFVLERLLRAVSLASTDGSSTWSLADLRPNSTETVIRLLDLLAVLVSGVIPVWILPAAGISFLEASAWERVVQGLMLVRFLRLARFYRVAEEVPALKDVEIFLTGIGKSGFTWLWSICVLCIFTLGFGILGLLTVSTRIQDLLEEAPDPVLEAMFTNYLGSLSKIMYTLMLILTGQVTCTTFITDVAHYIWWSPAVFNTYLSLMELIILNLITATLVENSIGLHQQAEQSRREAQQTEEAQRQVQELKTLFAMLDSNQDGTLSWMEFKEGLRHKEIKRKWRALNFKPEEAKSCFRLLDRDGTGEVQLEDFFEGLQRMQGVAQSKDLFRVVTLLETLLDKSGRPSALAKVSQLRRSLR